MDRVDFNDGDVACTSVDSPIYKIYDKRRLPNSRESEYQVEHVDGYKYWTPASKLSDSRSYIDDYENATRMNMGLPPLRRSPRFADLDKETRLMDVYH